MYMALHIQDQETDHLARQLSAVTGLTITQAVNGALREQLKLYGAPIDEDEYIARIEKITDQLACLPILDDRTPDEIIGYNDQGLFD